MNNKKACNLFVPINWFPDTTGFWYIDFHPGGKKFKKLDLEKQLVTDLFDHAKVADIIEEKFNEKNNPDSLAFSKVVYINKDTLRISLKDKCFDLNLNTYQIQEFMEKNNEKAKAMRSISPDGKWIAFARNNNLFIESTESGQEYQLSTDGTKNYEYASDYGWDDLIEGENGDRPEHFSVSWSPDSRYIQTFLYDLKKENIRQVTKGAFLCE